MDMKLESYLLIVLTNPNPKHFKYFVDNSILYTGPLFIWFKYSIVMTN